MNLAALLCRVKGQPKLAYVGATNRPLLKFLVSHVRHVGDKHRHLEFPVMVWGQKAEVVNSAIKDNTEITICGSLDQDFFSMNHEDPGRRQTIIIADTVTVTQGTPTATPNPAT